ncbi:hypothetical protein PAI11_37460 [Patulibacter medicamentivorans]|uniref:ADP ribosyltransferase domain-containing protein n=1 Tax=Patulibacter medicamentivorans TaxID=1097667 RepID=H0EA72_9ACTN|nr:ADP-ribosyltransferase [Patulibacter medicamentivorans]EHN09412.1 hypothetical protein PAI11_37460 [Patulibacter medicamentivorans]
MSGPALRRATDAAQAAWDRDVGRVTARWAREIAQSDRREDAYAALSRMLEQQTRTAAQRGAVAVSQIVRAAGVDPVPDVPTVSVRPPRNLNRTIARDWLAADSAADPAAAREAALRRIIDLSLSDAWRDGMDSAMDADPAVTGWRRVSRAGCCGACLVLADTRVRALDERFPRHPHCRCIKEPVVRDVNEHDAGRATPQQRWDAMTTTEQDAMFAGHGGAAKADAIRSGLPLAELVTFRDRNVNVQQPLVEETTLAALARRVPLVRHDAITRYLDQHHAPTGDDADALRRYSTPALAAPVNDALRDLVPLSDEAAGLIADLDRAMTPLQRPVGGVFRGLATVGRWLVPAAEMQPGDILDDPGFTSVSLAAEISEAFAGDHDALLIQLHIPAGTPVAWVAPVSGAPEEQELLLARGGRIVLDEVDPTISPVFARATFYFDG